MSDPRTPEDPSPEAAEARTTSLRKRDPGALPGDLHGPSPNIATNLAIADIALRGGTALARQAIERALLGRKYAPSKAARILKGRTMGESLLHGALAKIALRSVPGAIVVGGALLAKTLYDRTKAQDARREGEAALEEMALSGEEDGNARNG